MALSRHSFNSFRFICEAYSNTHRFCVMRIFLVQIFYQHIQRTFTFTGECRRLECRFFAIDQFHEQKFTECRRILK